MATPISDKYEVLSQIGAGGMGVVYKVRHKALGTILAIKTLPADLMDTPGLVARFTREARVMGLLKHNNIVQSVDFDFDGSLYYLVMEYIEGKTLKQYVNEKGPLPLPDVLEIARQAASALALAHNNNPPIIHRDIKPANLMIEDTSKRVVVMDFGIAKELGGGRGDETKTGAMLGTVKYCSPEQLRYDPQNPLDGRADIYSLGLVLYELYTGKQFFAGLAEHDVIGKLLYESQEHEVHLTRPTPEKFAALLTKAIAKNRQRRHQRMEELLRDLEACQATLKKGNDDTDTLTIVRPLPGGSVPSPQEPVEVEDLEKQIQQLQQERERRLAATMQRQAQEVREQAARAGAADYASALFQQALAREDSGSKSFREKNYLLAQTAYQEASALFERARDEATVEATKQAGEQAREEVTAIKAEAERYGARERARTFYGRALALQAQADDWWERKDYAQAGQLYAQARGVFEDACELARRALLREEAATARQAALTAKEAAADAAQLAAAQFQEAASTEQQANRAMELEEFTQARQLYWNAQEKYEHARDQAQRERQHQLAVAAQQEAARERAEAARRQTQAVVQDLVALQPWAGPQWQEAQRVEAEAQQAFATHAYNHATERYAQAQQCYAAAGEEAEEARRAQREKERVAAAAAYAHSDQARIQAEQAGARKRFADAFAQGQRLVAQGRTNEQQAQYVQARLLYEQAGKQFADLRQEARLQADREDTEAVRQQMELVRERVRPLQPWAAELWTQAQQHEAAAEQAYRDTTYKEAVASYEQAAQTYEQVGVEGRRAQLREQAARAAQREQAIEATAAARQRMRNAQTEAEQAGAAERFRELFTQAQQLAQQGRAHEQRDEFTQAATLYDQGAQECTRLREEALKAVAREHAQTAQRHSEAIKRGIADLTPWAGPRWHQAQEFEAKAQRAFADEAYDQATDFSTRAGQSYEAAGKEAEEARQRQQQKAREAALSGYEHVKQERTQAEQAGARQRFQEAFVQAHRLVEQGQASTRDAHYEQACSLYEQATEQFVQLRHEAVLQAARERADEARRSTEPFKQESAFLARWAETTWTEAQRIETEAAHAWQLQEYALATERYIQAAQHYEQARREAEEAQQQFMQAQAEQERQTAALARAAAQARDRARALQSKTATATGRQKRRADKAFATAEQCWQQHKYAEAQTGYEQAAALFAALPTHEPRPWSRTARRSAAAIVLAAAVGIIVAFWIPSPQQSEPAKPADTALPIQETTPEPKKPADTQPPTPETTPELEKPPAPAPLTTKTTPEPPPPPPPTITRVPPKEGEEVNRQPQVVTLSPQPEPVMEVTPEEKAVKAIPPPPPLPLLITRALPKPVDPISVAEGKSLTFAIETQGPSDAPLRYAWFLDGKTQRGEKTWTYRPDFSAAGAKPKEVKVVVSGQNNLKAEQVWRVGVQDVNQPPRVTSASPRPETTVELTPEERRDFAVKAIDPDPDDRLVYNWFVNDNAVPCKTPTCRFSTSSSDQPRYTVRVDISDTKDNGKVQVAWNITVRSPEPPRRSEPKPQPEEEEVVAVKPVPPPPAGPDPLTPLEVEKWLETYRRAWEGMCEQDNTTTLLRLRVTLDQSLDPTRRTICSYSSYRVALQNPTPRVEGKQATVTFDRVDTIDGREMKPVRLTFTIEKEANGRIVRQR